MILLQPVFRIAVRVFPFRHPLTLRFIMPTYTFISPDTPVPLICVRLFFTHVCWHRITGSWRCCFGGTGLEP